MKRAILEGAVSPSPRRLPTRTGATDAATSHGLFVAGGLFAYQLNQTDGVPREKSRGGSSRVCLGLLAGWKTMPSLPTVSILPPYCFALPPPSRAHMDTYLPSQPSKAFSGMPYTSCLFLRTKQAPPPGPLLLFGHDVTLILSLGCRLGGFSRLWRGF